MTSQKFFVRWLSLARKEGDRPSGFTLVEVLIVVVIIAIIASIAIPSWLGFITTRRVNRAQRDALNIMRDAQAKAQKEKRGWTACFRDEGGRLEYTILAGDRDAETGEAGGCDNGNIGWLPLGEGDADKVRIDTTTVTTANIPLNATGDYAVGFDFRGQVDLNLPNNGLKVGFTARNVNSSTRRCVIVTTILGVMQTAEGDDC